MLEDAPDGVTPEQWMRALAASLLLPAIADGNQSTLEHYLRFKVPQVYDYIKSGKTPQSR